MGPFILAWLVGEGIIIYRSVHVQKVFPGPGQLLFSSGIFVILALIAEAPQAKTVATTLAWGFDIAAYMRLFDPAGAGGKMGSVKDISWPPAQLPDSKLLP